MRNFGYAVLLFSAFALLSSEASAQRWCKVNSHWSARRRQCVCQVGYQKTWFGANWYCRYVGWSNYRRCKPHSHYNYDTRRCHCNPGFKLIFYSERNWYCQRRVKRCKTNSHHNPYTGMCKCDAGYRMVKYSPTNWYCTAMQVCPPNSLRTGAGQCRCKIGFYKTSTGNSWFCRPGICRRNSYFSNGYCFCNAGYKKVKYSDSSWYCVRQANYSKDKHLREGHWKCNPGWSMRRYADGTWFCGITSARCKPNSHLRADGLCFCNPGFKVSGSGTANWFCSY